MLNNLISIDSSDASEDNTNRSKSFLNPNLTNLKKNTQFMKILKI